MNSTRENRSTFFMIRMDLDESTPVPESYKEEINNRLDLSLSDISPDSSVIYERNNRKSSLTDQMILLIKTNKRKRRGQINKILEKNFKNTSERWQISPLNKEMFHSKMKGVEIANKDSNNEYSFKLVEQEGFDKSYKGEDLKIFENKENFRAWQKTIYNKIFDKYNLYNEPDPRKIISIVDKKGNTGKSSFWKYISFKHPNSVAKITFGTASQLRTSIVNAGEKKLYILDVTRTMGKYDNIDDVLSVIEELKNGYVVTHMYGSDKKLLCKPPHVIISTNTELDYSKLSADRWEVYKINKKNKLVAVKVEN